MNVEYIKKISPEITKNIFKYLGIEYLTKCQLVCKNWREIIKNNKETLFYGKLKYLYIYLYKKRRGCTIEYLHHEIYISVKLLTNEELLKVRAYFYFEKKIVLFEGNKLKKIRNKTFKSLKGIEQIYLVNKTNYVIIDKTSCDLFEQIIKGKKYISLIKTINIKLSDKLSKLLEKECKGAFYERLMIYNGNHSLTGYKI